VLAGVDGWVGWMWIPPTHQGHDFQLCFFRGECEKHHSMEEIGPIEVDLKSQQLTIEGVAVGIIRNTDWM